MWKLIANVCLEVGHARLMLPVTVVGIVFHCRWLYERMICSLLFSMIINSLLKRFFKIPLFPHLGPGYAFPSGHMHSATMFYGYALYRAKSMWTRALMVLAMLAEGFSLIYFRFHDLPDLIGSLGFAAIEILCYHQLISKFGERRGEQYAITIAISISLFSMITMSILYRIPDHAWVAFYGLVGVAATMPLFTDRKLKTLRQKLLALLTISITSYLLHLVFGIINFQHYALSRIEFMLLPLVVFGSIGLYGEKG